MRLGDFILSNIEPILVEWESFARSMLPGKDMTVVALRDDAESILLAAARDMQTSQTLEQRASKSKGDGGAGGEASESLDKASGVHGIERVGAGFHITEVIAEYRALRASVLRRWRESLPAPDLHDIDDITRFNESLDQSLASGVGSYAQRLDESRQMFLAILSHDLRNPLTTIRVAASAVSQKNADPDTANVMAMIKRNADEMMQLVRDLIDFSAGGLGRQMPLNRGMVNLEVLSRDVIESFCSMHPDRKLRMHSDGDLIGFWDASRIRQVISNLIGNAIQHGAPDAPIDLSIVSEGTPSGESGAGGDTVVMRVRNAGAPIPPRLLQNIFDPLKRYAIPDSTGQVMPGSMGLGLYIVREIVAAKGGTVTVSSNAEDGTTFTVRIPRYLQGGETRNEDRTRSSHNRTAI